MKIENLVNINKLIQIYGNLLSIQQLEALKLYYECDCSLNEISEQMSVTRQGVRNYIISAQTKLQEYDNKLNLLSKNKRISDICDELLKNSCIANNKINSILGILEE